MPKRRRSKAFWKNFKFKYKLTIVNENTLEEIVGLRVSKLNGLSVLLCVLAVLFLIASCIITFTPLRNYLPGYMNSEVRTQIVDNALRVDSLQQVLNKQNLYIMNIQDIFSGKVSIDSVQTLDSLTTAREDTLMERTKREEEFRRLVVYSYCIVDIVYVNISMGVGAKCSHVQVTNRATFKETRIHNFQSTQIHHILFDNFST